MEVAELQLCRKKNGTSVSRIRSMSLTPDFDWSAQFDTSVRCENYIQIQ